MHGHSAFNVFLCINGMLDFRSLDPHKLSVEVLKHRLTQSE